MQWPARTSQYNQIGLCQTFEIISEMNDYIKITEIIDTILEENQSKFTMNWQKYILYITFQNTISSHSLHIWSKSKVPVLFSCLDVMEFYCHGLIYTILSKCYITKRCNLLAFGWFNRKTNKKFTAWNYKKAPSLKREES